MKRSVLSIIISLLGLYFIFWFNHFIYETIMVSGLITFDQNEFNPRVLPHSYIKVCKIVSICISLLSLYLGIIALKKSPKIAGFSIVLSLVLMIVTFIPFWSFFLDNSLEKLKHINP